MIRGRHRTAQETVSRNHRGRRAVGMGMATGHKITITPARLHVEITLAGVKLAESDRPVLLAETGLLGPLLPAQGGRAHGAAAAQRPAGTTCPFKGQASYWSVQADDEFHDDLIWSYENPIPAAAEIAGLMCFYDERAELTIDGEQRP